MELMPNIDLHHPTTVEEAIAAYTAGNSSRYLAGGSDMLVNIRRGIEHPDSLVYLNGIPEMHGISDNSQGITIGASTVLREIAESEVLQQYYTALATAAGEVAGPSHREYGTLGGNLCLDTRCIYYNQSEWWRSANDYCLKHRGEICHVAPGGKRCFATFSGDLAPALLLFDAEVELAGAAGRRRIPLTQFYRDDGMDHLTLSNGEILIAVHLPFPPDYIATGYAKSRIRGSIDFPLAGVAVRLGVVDSKINDLRVGLTGVSPLPFLSNGLDKFLGNEVDEKILESLRDHVRAQAKAMKTSMTPPHYRRRVAGGLAQKIAEAM